MTRRGAHTRQRPGAAPAAALLGLLSALLLPGTGRAADPLELVVTDGHARPGDVVTVEIAASPALLAAWPDEALSLRAEVGVLEGAPAPAGPGRWRQLWRLPATSPAGGSATFQASLGEATIRRSVALASDRDPGLSFPERIDRPAGSDSPIQLRIEGPDLPAADAVQATAGAVPVSVFEEGDVLSVRLRPESSPLPRVIPVAVRDGRDPAAPPAWTAVRLYGRPRIPVETEPGSQVTLTVGDRSYGPFEAGTDGIAQATAEVWPGETSADVVARDRLGNERRTRIALGGAPQPVLALLATSDVVPGRPLPDLYVLALRADGRPWRGTAPSCRAGVGEALPLVSTGAGQWRAALPASSRQLFDVRVECELGGQVREGLRVPVDSGIPATVELRVWPPEVDADLPLAQVQAWLEGAAGERLPTDDLSLAADRGRLTRDPDAGPGVAVAAYDGTAAVAAGEDRLVARWAPPAGTGPVLDLRVGLDRPPEPDAPLALAIVALDGSARPLAGEPVQVQILPSEDGGPGLTFETTTDDDGRAVVEVPRPGGREAGPWAVRVASGAIERNRLLLPGDGALPIRAGLERSLRLPVRTGQIARVAIDTEPAEVSAGGAESARLRVRLTDAGGNPVRDAEIRVDAGAATVGRVRPAADGSLEALVTPPARMPYGSIELRVEAADGTLLGTERLEVAPRSLRLAPGLVAGGLFGDGGIRSPWVGLEIDGRLASMPPWLVARLTAGAYRAHAEGTDETTGALVSVDTDVYPVSLGALAREQRGRLVWFGGLGIGLAPYRQRVTFDEATASSGLGFSAGPEFTAGLGLRLGGSELQLQATYLYLDMQGGDVRWAGLFGGLRPTLAWKLLL